MAEALFARIWYEPSGQVKLTLFIEGDPAQAVNTLIQDGHVSKAATFDDVASQAELDTLVPAIKDTSQVWAKNPTGRGVVLQTKVVQVDAVVP